VDFTLKRVPRGSERVESEKSIHKQKAGRLKRPAWKRFRERAGQPRFRLPDSRNRSVKPLSPRSSECFFGKFAKVVLRVNSMEVKKKLLKAGIKIDVGGKLPAPQKRKALPLFF
jgi:hypothetical protein